jgi:hypothetical protein
MTCQEAAEFVSALCDGETIPRTAAEHVGACEACHARLTEYMEMGGELRRMASLEFSEQLPARVLETQHGVLTTLWRRGWEMMRIPRLAFASMLAVILVLGSGLAVVSVRAHTQGTVVLLKISPASGQSNVCPLSTEDKKWQSCALLRLMNSNSGMLRYEVKFLSKDGNRIELGIRKKYSALGPGFRLGSIEDLPEEKYWFEPGETLQVDVAGFGTMAVTGEWMDHMPSLIADNHDLDPGPEEFRMISPLLLQGKEVVGEFEGAMVIVDKTKQGILMYLPGQGRFELALSPLTGAVQGSVKLNRISFEIDGQSYVFLTGTPIARSEQVWILRDANFKPSGEFTGASAYIGPVNLNQLAHDSCQFGTE